MTCITWHAGSSSVQRDIGWLVFREWERDVPSVLWYCWLGLLTCENRLPYNLYCVGVDVKHCSIQSSVKEMLIVGRWCLCVCVNVSRSRLGSTRVTVAVICVTVELHPLTVSVMPTLVNVSVVPVSPDVDVTSVSLATGTMGRKDVSVRTTCCTTGPLDPPRGGDLEMCQILM